MKRYMCTVTVGVFLLTVLPAWRVGAQAPRKPSGPILATLLGNRTQPPMPTGDSWNTIDQGHERELTKLTDYKFRTIDVPGTDFTIAQGINEKGRITGVSGLDASGWIRSGGAFTNYQVGEPQSAEINSINNRKVAIGDYFGDDGMIHGFTLFRGVTTDADFPGATLTVPAHINDSGAIVGVYTNDPNFEVGYHGYVRIDDVYTSFDHPGIGVTDTFAYGNNDQGDVVGFYFDAAGGHSFLLSGGTYTEIAVPGAVYTQASDINEFGEIVGHYQTTPGLPASRPEHGFLYSNGQYFTVDYPGAAATRLFSINNRHHQVVGWYIDASGGNHGFVATPR